jgi:hypothetical protein
VPVSPIRIPRPKAIVDLNRPVNALLRSQVQHLQQAENRLPLRYRSDIYIHAIQSEGEAADYIREVTEAIQRAHKDAARRRSRKRKRGKTSVASKGEQRKTRPRTSRKKREKKDRRI